LVSTYSILVARNTFTRNDPSVKEYRANLEAILKRDCSDTLAGPVNRTLKLGTWPSYGDKEIDTRIEEFALQEIRISQRPCEDLVKPSGKLSAPLFLQLHYPTFRSQRTFLWRRK
jgi:hypothetical protein